MCNRPNAVPSTLRKPRRSSLCLRIQEEENLDPDPSTVMTETLNHKGEVHSVVLRHTRPMQREKQSPKLLETAEGLG